MENYRVHLINSEVPQMQSSFPLFENCKHLQIPLSCTGISKAWCISNFVGTEIGSWIIPISTEQQSQYKLHSLILVSKHAVMKLVSTPPCACDFMNYSYCLFHKFFIDKIPSVPYHVTCLHIQNLSLTLLSTCSLSSSFFTDVSIICPKNFYCNYLNC